MDYQSPDLPTYEEALKLPKAYNIPPVSVSATATLIQTTPQRPTEEYNSVSTSQEHNTPSLRSENLVPEGEPTTTDSVFSGSPQEHTSNQPEPTSSYYYENQPNGKADTDDLSSGIKNNICDDNNGPKGFSKIGNNEYYINYELFSAAMYERRENTGKIVNVIAFEKKIEIIDNHITLRKYSDNNALEFYLPIPSQSTKVIIPMNFHKLTSKKKKFYGCVIAVLLFIMLICTCYGLSVVVGVTV
ncbi:hypothetical protein NEPAR04_2084 [Nematocida parisii]|nr:hypothetical protein NEPAR03_1735 [Nematocida parisii]KAI5130651.1 hypothetical protein NEPAR08_2160 [Nematocida parisii]KAI5144442.1 hypothetical protein NEPAR04_2084 [Nematocida parisii]